MSYLLPSTITIPRWRLPLPQHFSLPLLLLLVIDLLNRTHAFQGGRLALEHLNEGIRSPPLTLQRPCWPLRGTSSCPFGNFGRSGNASLDVFHMLPSFFFAFSSFSAKGTDLPPSSSSTTAAVTSSSSYTQAAAVAILRDAARHRKGDQAVFIGVKRSGRV